MRQCRWTGVSDVVETPSAHRGNARIPVVVMADVLRGEDILLVLAGSSRFLNRDTNAAECPTPGDFLAAAFDSSRILGPGSRPPLGLIGVAVPAKLALSLRPRCADRLGRNA